VEVVEELGSKITGFLREEIARIIRKVPGGLRGKAVLGVVRY